MFLTDLSIKRPVVASVMSMILVVFGLVVVNDIPTDELPDVQRPIITIQTNVELDRNLADYFNFMFGEITLNSNEILTNLPAYSWGV